MNQILYNSFNTYLKDKYGEKIWRIPVSRNVICPHFVDNGGCSFCDEYNYKPEYLRNENTEFLEKQLERGVNFFGERYKVKSFLGYFQSGTNTAGDITELRKDFEYVISKNYVKGLVIATRPDYIYDNVLEMINFLSLKYDKEIWIELGLQSTNDNVLQIINRGHTYFDFRQAMLLLEKYSNLKTAVHMIIGLPTEGPDEVINNTRELFDGYKIDGIKYRILDIIHGTGIENLYNDNSEIFYKFTIEEFVNLIVNLLEYIPPETVIMRYANFKSLKLSENEKKSMTKSEVIRRVIDRMDYLNTYQGKKCK